VQTCRQYLAGEQIGLLGAEQAPGKPCQADVQNEPSAHVEKLAGRLQSATVAATCS
jgi:hypothetical protein